MIDITDYTEHELSLHVFNTECLYSTVDNLPVLLEIVQDNFLYTQDQLETLLEDIANLTDEP